MFSVPNWVWAFQSFSSRLSVVDSASVEIIIRWVDLLKVVVYLIEGRPRFYSLVNCVECRVVCFATLHCLKFERLLGLFYAAVHIAFEMLSLKNHTRFIIRNVTL